MEEAIETFLSLLFEYAEETEQIKQEVAEDFLYNKNNYLIDYFSFEKLNSFLKTHKVEYDNPDEMVERKKHPVIVVYDEKIDKFLIIDGNHRVNTYSQIAPLEEIEVFILKGTILPNMGQ